MKFEPDLEEEDNSPFSILSTRMRKRTQNHMAKTHMQVHADRMYVHSKSHADRIHVHSKSHGDQKDAATRTFLQEVILLAPTATCNVMNHAMLCMISPTQRLQVAGATSKPGQTIVRYRLACTDGHTHCDATHART